MPPYESDSPERPPASDATALAEPPLPRLKRSRRRRLPVLLLAVAIAAAVVGAFAWWLEARQWESTDDAFIDVHMVHVAPQVAGRVARVLVDDNQRVKPGDVLVEIDPADFQASLDQALASQANAAADLARAKAQQEVDGANAEQSLAQIGVAEANAKVAEIQLKRDRAQAAAKAISSQQLDNSIANAQSSAASLVAAQKKHASDEALLAVAASQVAAAKASLEGATAQVAQARLNLSYTRIVAPEAGRIAHKNVAPGDYVQTGQNLMALVPLKVWITANFKETQLDLMRVGQPVEIQVDAYPDQVFKGHVDSFQPGSGAAFSLLPPENATGNYVKVVQRVPVKIVFDDPPDLPRPLGPGMSVVPSVKVR
ncbi:HlyD family secretion protein [Enhydrobacter sp.]|jgi:membrane fusion protein (multidrug efflux system)|uniref:HlyD family secretion protein n=1 Tax=Enhydrobacter sp. TaxID=1894999 RepID=UPI00261F58BF|nr:HlyD family secretion protein [Enhydrobacter sp.]WIM10290.1 MAG: Membrane fusion component of MSF-type tripartite multidrug efflux system [Enhydrobacter sp.]